MFSYNALCRTLEKAKIEKIIENKFTYYQSTVRFKQAIISCRLKIPREDVVFTNCFAYYLNVKWLAMSKTYINATVAQFITSNKYLVLSTNKVKRNSTVLSVKNMVVELPDPFRWMGRGGIP